MNRWLRRGIVAGMWIGIIVAFQVSRIAAGLDPLDALQEFVRTAAEAWWAIPVFIGLYLLRPVLLIPGTILTVVGGMLFGAALGIPVVLVAANGSALVAFGIGVAFIGPRSPVEQTPAATTLRARWAERMRRNAFESILLMRLLFLPYDLVSYTAGMLRMRWQPFLAANAIGILPGTIAFVLLGASLTDLSQGIGGVDWRVLLASVGLCGVSIGLSQLIKRRTAATEAS